MRTTLTKIAGGGLLLLVATLLIAPRVEAQTRFSGSTVANEIDVDDDGTNGGTVTFQSRGPFGKARSRSHIELAPWDMMTFCGDNSILFVYTVSTQVTTFANGDQLYESLNNGTICANVVDNSFTFEVKSDVTGGTGKFEGATGTRTASGSGQVLQGDPVPNRPALSAFSGTLTDDIVFAP